MALTTVSKRSLQIIAALGSAERPLEKAEQCLEIHNQQTMYKQNCQQQHWTTELIDVLCAEEPVIRNDKMEFIPKISMLPVDIQRNALAFLINHAAEIPNFALNDLVSTLQSIQQELDEWCRFHTASLLNISHQRRNKQCFANQEGMPSHHDLISCRQKISESSRRSFDDVCKAVLDGESDSGRMTGSSKMRFDWMSDTGLRNLEPCLTNQDDSTKPCEDGSRKRAHSSADEIVIHKRSRLDQKDGETNTDTSDPADEVGSLDDLFPASSPDGESKHEGTAIVSPSLPAGSVVQVSSTEGESVIEGSDMKPGAGDVGPEQNDADQSKISTDLLKTELMSCSAGSTFSESAQGTIQDILQSSGEQGALWDALGDIPLNGLESLCQFVVQSIGPAELSYISALTMASKCFCKKLQESTATIPRALSSTLFTFTKAFPKPAIEGVLLPSITNEPDGATMKTALFDMVAKMTKDVLADEYTMYLLNGLLLNQDLKWSELHTTLLQSILSKKLELDPKSLSTLVTSLEHHGIAHNACKKFAKLLLLVINQYGKKMTTSDVSRMQSLVTANKTFLKKAALSALKKLHPT